MKQIAENRMYSTHFGRCDILKFSISFSTKASFRCNSCCYCSFGSIFVRMFAVGAIMNLQEIQSKTVNAARLLTRNHFRLYFSFHRFAMDPDLHGIFNKNRKQRSAHTQKAATPIFSPFSRSNRTRNERNFGSHATYSICMNALEYSFSRKHIFRKIPHSMKKWNEN